MSVKVEIDCGIGVIVSKNMAYRDTMLKLPIDKKIKAIKAMRSLPKGIVGVSGEPGLIGDPGLSDDEFYGLLK
jgi:hypothetical protein